MDTKLYRYLDDIAWRPHPVADGVTIKPLVTKRGDKAEVSCLLVKIEAGREVPVHIHEDSDDIIFPLSGEASMFIEGMETLELKEGMIVRVPKGTKHKIFNVTKDLLLYDVFSPATI